MRLSPIAALRRGTRDRHRGVRERRRERAGLGDGAAQVVPRMRSRSSRRARTSPRRRGTALGSVRARSRRTSWTAELQARRGRRGRRRGASRRQDRRVRAARRTSAKLDGAREEARLQDPHVRRLDRGRARRRGAASWSRTRRRISPTTRSSSRRWTGCRAARSCARTRTATRRATLLASIPGQLESRLHPARRAVPLRPDRPGMRTAVGVGTERVPLARGRADVARPAG